jgi:hypothetical protein
MNSAKTNISKLPEQCFGVLMIDESLIVIKAGESGYWPAHHGSDNLKNYKDAAATVRETTEELCDRLNAEEGVTRGQRKAMEYGSMWGWEIPLADPDNYFPDGEFRHSVSHHIEKKYKDSKYELTANGMTTITQFVMEALKNSPESKLLKDVKKLWPNVYKNVKNHVIAQG